MGDLGSGAIYRVASSLIIFWVIFGFSLLIAGICCMCLHGPQTICTTKSKYVYDDKRYIYDYTNCTNNDDKLCHKIIQSATPCTCIIEDINIGISGDVVVLYQLDNFNESSAAKQPNFFQSRDDKQLSGIVTATPANSCQPYDYDENKLPIAPCGALANAMFNDTITISIDMVDLPTVYNGLLTASQKEGFRNPKTSDNLTIAFQNFSRPINWEKNIWELDPSDPNNNGFENEAFIAWMTVDMNLKPLWRLDRSKEPYTEGMPNGTYRMDIIYRYPTLLYNGTKTVVIAVRNLVEWEVCILVDKQSTVLFDIGLSGIIIGAIFLLLGSGLTVYEKMKDRRTKRKLVNGDDGTLDGHEPKTFAEPIKRNLIESGEEPAKPNENTAVTPALKNTEPEEKLLKNKGVENKEILDDDDFL